MVHVPIHIEDYHFDAAEYMAHDRSAGSIEMHAFPQARLLELARGYGFRLADVVDVAGRMRHRMIQQLFTFQRMEASEPSGGRADTGDV